MSEGYWVKGYPYKNADRTACSSQPVIHRFDSEKEALFFKGQVANGTVLNWGKNASGKLK